MDFLVLYGSFGGDVNPSDDDEEDEPYTDDLERTGGRTERSPLLSRRNSCQPTTNLQGTSPKKAFFMIMKVNN